MSLDRRLAGVLLHPTSLPGRYGIGDLGPECLHFLDWMQEAGLGAWQVLPLGPTGYGDSPYQCFSAFAGNPMLISPDLLLNEGLAGPEDVQCPPFPEGRVDYGPVIEWKYHLLRRVHARFRQQKPKALVEAFNAFRKRRDVKHWLPEYALFRVCKDRYHGAPWDQWEAGLRRRDPKALAALRKRNADTIDFHEFAQFLFFRQWEAVREAALARGIFIIGDAPIYVAYDSADTWANQEMFQLDKEGLPIAVAGVPPDYFSETGQLWGNPLYNWEVLKKTKYAWWMRRFEAIFAQVDLVRLDHFRGFMGYWSVPYGEKTAVKGRWRRGPGAEFFKAVKRKFKDLPIIAEDLGEITPDVFEVRDQFGLPGMKIMQFAWDVASTEPLIPSPGNAFQIHNHVQNCIVYTGTHDNDTTVGWWNGSSKEEERHHLRVYMATDGGVPHWDLIRVTFMSVANTAIVPMQDFLGLGTECRMNFPGRAEGNWTWRLVPEQLNGGLAEHIRGLTLLYQRCANPPAEALPEDDTEKRNYLAGDDEA